MSTHGAGGTRARSGGQAKSTPKATAVVTRTAMQNGARWHSVTVTRPDGSQMHVQVNAAVFPTRTAAKAEALRYAEHGPDQNVATVMTPGSHRESYDAEVARLGASANESSARQEQLAAVARREGLNDLATAHDEVAAALRAVNQQAVALVMTSGRGKAATAQRAEINKAMDAAQARLRQAQAALAARQSAAQPTPPPARPSRSRGTPTRTSAPKARGVGIQTLAAYENAHEKAYRAGTSGVTQREYRDAYPRGSRTQEWHQALVEHARSGGTLTARVLDDVAKRLGENALRPFLHDWPASVPKGYLSPAARARQQDQSFPVPRPRAPRSAKRATS